MTTPVLAAGRLRHRVQILRYVDTANGKGGFVRTWNPVGSPVRAEVIGQGGREALIELSMKGIETYRVTMRKRDDLRPSDQLRWNGKDLNIRTIEADATNAVWLSIMCDTQAQKAR